MPNHHLLFASELADHEIITKRKDTTPKCVYRNLAKVCILLKKNYYKDSGKKFYWEYRTYYKKSFGKC